MSKRQELVQKTDLKSLMWQTLGYIADGDNKVKHVIGCIVRLKKKSAATKDPNYEIQISAIKM